MTVLATVLFVDDEPEVTRALRRALRMEPFRILVAASAAEALEVLAHESVDVLITDESMPGTRGSRLLATARQGDPDLITMVLTGHASHESKIRELAEGNVQRFFTKPCSASEIGEAIRAAVSGRHRRGGGRKVPTPDERGSPTAR